MNGRSGIRGFTVHAGVDAGVDDPERISIAADRQGVTVNVGWGQQGSTSSAWYPGTHIQGPTQFQLGQTAGVDRGVNIRIIPDAPVPATWGTPSVVQQGNWSPPVPQDFVPAPAVLAPAPGGNYRDMTRGWDQPAVPYTPPMIGSGRVTTPPPGNFIDLTRGGGWETGPRAGDSQQPVFDSPPRGGWGRQPTGDSGNWGGSQPPVRDTSPARGWGQHRDDHVRDDDHKVRFDSRDDPRNYDHTMPVETVEWYERGLTRKEDKAYFPPGTQRSKKTTTTTTVTKERSTTKFKMGSSSKAAQAAADALHRAEELARETADRLRAEIDRTCRRMRRGDDQPTIIVEHHEHRRHRRRHRRTSSGHSSSSGSECLQFSALPLPFPSTTSSSTSSSTSGSPNNSSLAPLIVSFTISFNFHSTPSNLNKYSTPSSNTFQALIVPSTLACNSSKSDLTTIRKRIRRAKHRKIPHTTILYTIDKLKTIADIYATTAMGYVNARDTAEVYAISSAGLERLMRVKVDLERVGEMTKFDRNYNDGDDDDDEEVERGNGKGKQSELKNTRKDYNNQPRKEEREERTPPGKRSILPERKTPDKVLKPKQRQEVPRKRRSPELEKVDEDEEREENEEKQDSGFELMGIPDLGRKRRERHRQLADIYSSPDHAREQVPPIKNKMRATAPAAVDTPARRLKKEDNRKR
ncbi:hypothetical protein TWF281_001347 [Arthrobotrys megalospora]